jgi:hypothetical protein
MVLGSLRGWTSGCEFIFKREPLSGELVPFDCPAVSQSAGNEAVTIDDFATVDVEGEQHPLARKRRTAGGDLCHRRTVVAMGVRAMPNVSAADCGPVRAGRSYSAIWATPDPPRLSDDRPPTDGDRPGRQPGRAT